MSDPVSVNDLKHSLKEPSSCTNRHCIEFSIMMIDEDGMEMPLAKKNKYLRFENGLPLVSKM